MNCGSESLFTTVAIISSLFPDIDILFGKKINNHRNTIFHTPFFWVCLIFLSFSVGIRQKNYYLEQYTIAAAFGVFSHLFLDWFSGRTIGIRLLYPFSKKMYSLFPLKQQIGNIPLAPKKKYLNLYIPLIKLYFNNILLVLSELLILVFFILALIFK